MCCLSSFYAQVLGLYLAIVSFAILIYHQHYRKLVLEFVKNPTHVAFSGSLSLLIGLLVVIPHNLWISDWRVVVTLVGWIFLLQGVWRLFFAESFVKFTHDIMENKGFLLLSWIWFLVGIYLIWAGFSQ